MEKKNGFIFIKAEVVTKALVDSEIRFLWEPDAGPYEVPVHFNGTVLDTATVLRGLGGHLIVGGNGATKRFLLPKRHQVLACAKKERDEIISSHTRRGNHVRARGTGRPIMAMEFTCWVKATNRVIEILSHEKLGENFTSRAN